MHKWFLALPVGTLGAILALAPLAGADQPAAPAPPPAAPATPPASPSAEADAADIASVLTGGPDRFGQAGGALGKPFESLSAGISLRPPAGLKALRYVGKDDIVQFQTEDPDPANPLPDHKKWSLVVGKTSFPRAQALTAGPDARGRIQPGLLQNTVEAIKIQYGGGQGNTGIKVLREDLTNLGNHDVAMIVFRYTRGGERYFAQRAIIQANDQLFYLLALTSPARRDDAETPEDAGERAAVETFRAVLDSVKLLDRAAIRDDQVGRLERTRSLFTNLTATKISSVIVKEQWRRVLKDGKDIGYQYIVEDAYRKSGQDGLMVGVRTRIMPGGVERPYPREDSAANFFTTFDRHHEDWSKLTAIDDGKPKTAQNPWKKLTEFGTSDVKSRNSLLVDANDPNHPEHAYSKGEIGDPNNPWVRAKTYYTLDVQYTGTRVDNDPVSRPLPPYYLPQALGMMLPRLLPPKEQKSYLVATYVSDSREVMLRYLAVGAEQDVTLGGRRFRAVPIKDHVTLEGSVTTHYVDLRGNWLGSENKDTRITILPADARTLRDLWKDANLSRPDDQSADAPPAAAGPPAPVRGAAPLVNPTRSGR